jgi:putative flippase GtrA
MPGRPAASRRQPVDETTLTGDSDAPRRKLAGEFVRFAIVGGINTVVAYAVYLLLLQWIRYEVAYAIAYAAGIATAYVLSAQFVFRQPLRRRSAIRFPAVYVAQFLISFTVLKLAVDLVGMPRWMAMAAAIAMTMPATFVISRWILRRR